MSELLAEVSIACNGKTIKYVSINGVNRWTFHFVDGSVMTIMTVSVIPSINLYGIDLVRE